MECVVSKDVMRGLCFFVRGAMCVTVLFGYVWDQVEKKSHAASAPVGRSASYKRSGAWAVKKKNGGKFPVHKKTVKPEAKVHPRPNVIMLAEVS
jgi:hypothetical protein